MRRTVRLLGPGLILAVALSCTGEGGGASGAGDGPPADGALQVTVLRPVTGWAGEPIDLQLSASALDGDSFRYEARVLPAGAALDPASGALLWTPGEQQVGSHVLLADVVADRANLAVRRVSLQVRIRARPQAGGGDGATAEGEGEGPEPLGNRPPSISVEEAPVVAEGERIRILLNVQDPDGDDVALLAERLPSGALFLPGAAALSWRPSHEQAGVHLAIFAATDDGDPPRTSRLRLGVEVTEVNRPPDVTEPEAVELGPWARLDVTLRAHDPDGDPVRWQGVNLPEGATVEAQTGRVEWRPTEESIGAHEMEIAASDGRVPPGLASVILPVVVTEPEMLPMPCPEEGEPGPEPGPAEPWESAIGWDLATVLVPFAPESGGVSGPEVELLPRSGPVGVPLVPRLCITDADGPGNLDPDAVVVLMNGTRIDAWMRWARTGEHTICGEMSRACGYGAGGLDAWHRVTAWARDRDGNVGRSERRYGPARIDPVRFADVTEAAGLDGPSFTGNSHSGGVAWLDYDGDDWPDLFVIGGSGRSNRLFRNQRDGTFTDVSQGTPLEMISAPTTGVIFADVDNDGDDDVYVYSDHAELVFVDDFPNAIPGGENRLFRNDGEGRFTDITEASGLADLTSTEEPSRTISATFGDYDVDGCIDVFTVHWRVGTPADPVWDQDRLFRGDCAGGFEDVTAEAGLDGYLRKGFAALFADLSGDGLPDLYVGNQGRLASDYHLLQPDFRYGSDESRDLLFVNQGDGTFEERSVDAGVGADAVAAMGIEVADFDHDGDFELYVTDISEPTGYGNAYYRSLVADGGVDGQPGPLRFVEEAFRLGSRPLTGAFTWGVNAADFNNDGHQDLFAVGGGSRWLWVGDGTGEFMAVASPVPLGQGARERGYIDDSGIPPRPHGRGTAVADYDRDGDVDIVIWQQDQSPMLLRNEADLGHHWLHVRLRPVRTNRSAIGTRVSVIIEGAEGEELAQHAQVLAGSGQQSQSSTLVHFGLGTSVDVRRVEVRWPGAGMQVIESPAADQILEVFER